MIDEDELFHRLDAVLAGGKYDADVRRAASLSIGLCELLLDAMDDVQLEGLDAARLFWAGDETLHAHYLECFGKRIDADMKNPATDIRRASVNRYFGKTQSLLEVGQECDIKGQWGRVDELVGDRSQDIERGRIVTQYQCRWPDAAALAPRLLPATWLPGRSRGSHCARFTR